MADKVRGLITNDGRRLMAEQMGRKSDTIGIDTFRVGEGGFTTVSGNKEPKDPDPTRSTLESQNDSNLFTFQDSIPSGDIIVTEDSNVISEASTGAPVLQVTVLVEDTEANDDGSGNHPEFFEVGLFDDNDIMVFYGTYPGETKTSSTTLEKIANMKF